MALNKQKGNMYPWVTHTWNPLGGQCPHKCDYCYARPELQTKPNLTTKYTGTPRIAVELEHEKLGKGNTIFVQNMGDMFATGVETSDIQKILIHCNSYPENTYVFQTKNPRRIKIFGDHLPPKRMLGTTMETDPCTTYPHTEAPPIIQRAEELRDLRESGERVFVSIEPIMRFDTLAFVRWIVGIAPDFVSIGANSKRGVFDEPTYEKVRTLIDALGRFVAVRVKDNIEYLQKQR